MFSILRVFFHRLFFLLTLFLLTELFTPLAHADGGAPQLAYIAGSAQGLSIIDIARRHVTGTLTIAGNPRDVLLSPDGYALYVAQPGTGQVTAITAKTGKQLCAVHLAGQPSLLALSLDATTLYVAGQADTAVHALNPTTCTIQRTFETHEPVYGLAVAASTAANATPSTPNQLWISGTTSLTIFDVNGHLLGTTPVAGGPQHISIPGGFTAYVTTRQGSVVAVDLNKRQVIQTLLSRGQFGTMDYDAITGEIYVPDQQNNQLDVLAPVTAGTTAQAEPAHIFHLSGSPQSVAITSDGQFGFVALSNGLVLMLDIPARSTIASIAVGGTPHFIITGLYPPANSSPPVIQPTTAPSSLNSRNLLLIISAIVIGMLLLATLWFFKRRA